MSAGEKQLCEDAPNFEVNHQRLLMIESEYQKTKLLAENKIAQMKRTGGSNLEEFESEFHNFVNNYQIMLKLMEQKPSFCEKLIEELDESIKYFATHQLKSETY